MSTSNKNQTMIDFEIPESLLFILNQNQNEFKANVKLFIALEFFRIGKLSFEKAIELSGIDSELFKKELFERNIPLINYPAEDLEKELIALI